jgi:probable rRNA maturation factor
MDPSSRSGLHIIVADPAWRRLVPNAERLITRAAAGGAATIVLDSDRVVKHLNARHRGRNKATNVLTFEPAGPGGAGEIVLASGVVAREAAASGKRPGNHLAHLVIHGLLHLAGHDHHQAGPARRMEMAEARRLGRLHLPNPWRRG